MEEYDVLIVGAGIAGASTATFTCDRSPTIRVLLVDDQIGRSFKVGESLAASSKRYLKQLGILEKVEDLVRSGKQLTCLGNRSAWGNPNLHGNDSIFSPYGEGYHLDRSSFEELLLESARSRPNLVFKPMKVGEVKKSSQGWEVQSSEGLKIQAKILVDASGRSNFLSHHLGKDRCERMSIDNLLAFVGVFEEGESEIEDHDNFSTVEASRDGWWYSARLPEKKRIVVFHTDDDLPIAKTCRKDQTFMARLESDAPHIFDRITKSNYRLSRRIMCTSASSCIQKSIASFEGRFLSVGDSAVSFDPLSAQGMITALQCSAMCSYVVERSLDPNITDQTKEEDFLNYRREILEIFHKFAITRHRYYNMERRWPDCDFWKRRHSQK